MNDEMLLGIDVGSVRVGVARGTAGSFAVEAIGTYARKADKALQQILLLVSKNSVLKVVVGYPVDENGKLTLQCQDIEKFCHRLQRRAPELYIIRFDEYLSSLEAEEELSGRKKIAKLDLRGKGAVDAVAACVILRRYLEKAENRR